MKTNRLSVIFSLCIILTFFFFSIQSVYGKNESKSTIRQGSNAIGTASYEISIGMSKIINDHSDKIKIATTTGKSTVSSMRQLESGSVDAVYTNLWSMKDCYRDKGGWAKRSQRVKPLSAIWIYSAEFFIVTKAKRDDINCLRDLAGKRISVGYPGMSYREVYIEIFKKLGILDSIELKGVAGSENPDVLLTGIADALIGYTNLGARTFPSWMRDLDARVKIKVVKPSDEEWLIIQNMPEIRPYYTTEIPTKIFSQNVGTDIIRCPANAYGWGFGAEFDKGLVYEYMKVLFENTKDLVQTSAQFKQFQVEGKELNIKSNDVLSKIGIPIHPGAAQYLKKIGIWKSEWVEGKK